MILTWQERFLVSIAGAHSVDYRNHRAFLCVHGTSAPCRACVSTSRWSREPCRPPSRRRTRCPRPRAVEATPPHADRSVHAALIECAGDRSSHASLRRPPHLGRTDASQKKTRARSPSRALSSIRLGSIGAHVRLLPYACMRPCSTCATRQPSRRPQRLARTE